MGIDIANDHPKLSAVWYSPEVTSTSLFVPELFYKGILYPIDLIYNGNILSRENLMQIYNISIDFLTYHRLYSSLKKYIGLTNLNCNSLPRSIFPNQLKLLHKSDTGARDFYNTITSTSTLNNTYRQKWERDLDLNIGTFTWRNIYKTCFFNIKDKFFYLVSI